jgi:hypothetical protein
VIVFATFRSQKVPSKNVLSHEFVWVDASTMSPVPFSASWSYSSFALGYWVSVEAQEIEVTLFA